MSKQEAKKVTIIEELMAGRLTNKQAADLLGLSVRQVNYHARSGTPKLIAPAKFLTRIWAR